LWHGLLAGMPLNRSFYFIASRSQFIYTPWSKCHFDGIQWFQDVSTRTQYFRGGRKSTSSLPWISQADPYECWRDLPRFLLFSFCLQVCHWTDHFTLLQVGPSLFIHHEASAILMAVNGFKTSPQGLCTFVEVENRPLLCLE
jgi:hypothetical protein